MLSFIRARVTGNKKNIRVRVMVLRKSVRGVLVVQCTFSDVSRKIDVFLSPPWEGNLPSERVNKSVDSERESGQEK